MEESKIAELSRLAAIGLLTVAVAVTGAASQDKSNPKPAESKKEDGQKGEAKPANETKAAEASDAQSGSGKTVDTRPKLVERPQSARTSSPLVDAAKSAKANKQKARIVIDNDDVRKSTGKITVLKPRADVEVPTEGTAEKLEKEQRARDVARKQANDRVEAARKVVEDLEKELARLEEDYYTEADLDYRDDVIEQRFNEAKEQLDKARSELSAAHTEMEKAGSDPAPAAPTPAEKPPEE